MSPKIIRFRHYYLGILVGKSYRLKYYREHNNEVLWGIRQIIIDTKDDPGSPANSTLSKTDFDEMMRNL